MIYLAYIGRYHFDMMRISKNRRLDSGGKYWYESYNLDSKLSNQSFQISRQLCQ